MTSNRVRLRFVLLGLLAAGFLSLATGAAQSDEKISPRDQEIADLEKKIEELNKRLADLKRNGNGGSVAVTGVGTLPADWVKAFTWRPIGPAAMGGRITAISVLEADPSTYFVATGGGGLLKTVNNGITFEHQFDHEATVAIGDVCVATSDRNIVWVGTGENNPRNSVSYGDGVYKSTDGGKTWKNMGLKQSFQIGRIAIHPKDPNIVYVGALGRLYGPSEERGLYKTTNGGQTWDKILYVDNKTGVIDIQMHPQDPETLLVATYERERDLYDTNNPSKMYGPGSGLYKTTDGGKTFKKLTKGLPTCSLGRMGMSYYLKNPNTIFLILESEKNGTGPLVYMGVVGEDAPKEAGAKLAQITQGSPAEKAGFKADDVVVSFDGKGVKSYADLTKEILGHKPGDKVKVKVLRSGKEMELDLTLGRRGENDQRARGAGVSLGLMGDTVEDAGIRVTRILEGSAAAQAGIKEGDIIKAVGDKKVKTYAELADLIRGRQPGDKVKLVVGRAGKDVPVEVTLVGRGGFGGGTGRGDPTKPFLDYLSGQTENIQAEQGPDGFQTGGIYKSTDGGESWTRINSLNPRPMYFSQIRVDPTDENHIWVLGISMHHSSDGGKSFQRGGRGVHADQHALWIDPHDGRHMIVGCDGGFYATYDRGANWDHLNHLAIGQFYHVAIDTRPNYRVYGGLQDNGSWGGPSRTSNREGAVNEDWIMVGGGDGFVCQVDPNDPDQIYYESQNGGMGRRNLRTGEVGSVRPRGSQAATAPPGGAPSSAEGEVAPPRQRGGQGQQFRFNWKTPFILSHHNSRIYYCGGNYVFRSLDRGNDLRQISPEIARTKEGSATALAESPRNPNILYVGTDDGFLWVTRDGGKEWTNITANVGLPVHCYVASIEASRFEEGRAYVAFDGHRSNNDDPLVYRTEDFGKTWKSIRANLPWGSTRCLREDIQNPNLLFVGTEFAAWVSVDRGATWTRLNNNLPTVAIHDFAIHPTAGEIVAATHGRSLWVLDVTPLRQMSTEVCRAKATLYRPNTAVRARPEPSRGGTNRHFAGQNPAFGAQLFYSLGQKADQVDLKILDFNGKTVREFPGEKGPGLYRVAWDLSRTSGQGQPGGAGRRGGGTGGQGGGQRQGRGGFGRGGSGGQAVPAGTYRLVLRVDGQDYSQALKVEGEVAGGAPIIVQDDDDDDAKVIDRSKED